MSDIIEISYTGDILAHRRCPRAWAFEKHVGFHPYEQVQAMEGRLLHHAMEWLAREYAEKYKRKKHASLDELYGQMEHYFRVLWARGIRTAFTSKEKTLERVVKDHLFPNGKMHPTVKAVIEGARHTEYELRTVKKVIAAQFGGHSKLLLTGILDVVVQQKNAIRYNFGWRWDELALLEGESQKAATSAESGDLEIWDYKGTRSRTPYVKDYVRQLLTYAALYRERTGELPRRCVIFFVNEPDPTRQLLAISVTEEVLNASLEWTKEQVQKLQRTIESFENKPGAVAGGDLENRSEPIGEELSKQCTACGQRFDCKAYKDYLVKRNAKGRRRKTSDALADIDIENVNKN